MLAVLVAILILCSFTSSSLIDHPFDHKITEINQTTVNKDELSCQHPLELAEGLQTHDAIAINGDTDFNDTAYAKGWLGSGTEINPYILSNYSIIAAAPVIGNISWTPLEPLVNEPIDVWAPITNEHPLTMVLLRYDDGYIWRNLTMSPNGGPYPGYHAALPAIGEAGTIQIEVWALDSNGDWGFSDVMDIEIKQAVITTTIPTTSPIDPPDSTLMLLVASLGGIGSLVVIVALIIVRKRKKLDESLKVDEIEDPAVITEDTLYLEEKIEEQLVSDQKSVHALRGAEFVGNRLRLKVKVVNDTSTVITDVTITISSYPRDSLTLEGDISRIVPKIDPQGFRSPTFEFLPTQDCVRGNIVASISFADHHGEVHSMSTEPYIIRAVCDLLTPENISPEDFNLRLNDLEHGETTLRVEEWTPEEMQAKTLKVLETSNFFEVSCETEKIQEHVQSRVTGWAKGKYTGKNIGVEIAITGLPGIKGATCIVRMSGEDDAMIMPAIDEIGKKLSAWLCPMCGGGLPIESVREVKAGKTTVCPFCGISIDR